MLVLSAQIEEVEPVPLIDRGEANPSWQDRWCRQNIVLWRYPCAGTKMHINRRTPRLLNVGTDFISKNCLCSIPYMLVTQFVSKLIEYKRKINMDWSMRKKVKYFLYRNPNCHYFLVLFSLRNLRYVSLSCYFHLIKTPATKNMCSLCGVKYSIFN